MLPNRFSVMARILYCRSWHGVYDRFLLWLPLWGFGGGRGYAPGTVGMWSGHLQPFSGSAAQIGYASPPVGFVFDIAADRQFLIFYGLLVCGDPEKFPRK